MKKLLFGLLISVFALTACAPPTLTEPPSFIVEQPDQGDSSPDGGLTPVEYAVVRQLAGNLGLKINDISVVENKTTDFNDACLGISLKDFVCAQVITPGHIIVLDADSIQYEYHTNGDGSQIQPATLALTWSRDGGIAGFCDRMTVFLSGEVYGSQCNSEDGKMESFAALLSSEKRDQFSNWMGQYGEKTLDVSDPKGTADGMSLVIELFGNGNGKPGKPVQQKMFTWAQELYTELYK